MRNSFTNRHARMGFKLERHTFLESEKWEKNEKHIIQIN